MQFGNLPKPEDGVDWQSTNPQYIWNSSTITVRRKWLMTKSTYSSILKLATNSTVLYYKYTILSNNYMLKKVPLVVELIVFYSSLESPEF